MRNHVHISSVRYLKSADKTVENWDEEFCKKRIKKS